MCSTGIGGASAVIALEELVQAGARSLIRVGPPAPCSMRSRWGSHRGGGSGAQRRRLAGLPAPEYPACADIRLQASCSPIWRQRPASLARSGAPHDSFYRDDEQEVCRYWHQRGVLGADMETASLLAVGRLRKVRVAAVLCNVVAFEQDVQRGERLRSQRSRHDDRRAAGHRRRPPRPDA